MADISKVTYNSTQYNLKDTQTRSAIDSVMAEITAKKTDALESIASAAANEKSTAVSAISAEGTRVLGTIPADYSDLQAAVAQNEPSSSAAAAHEEGSYFVADGGLYEATANIASGGTLTFSGSGKNCKEVAGGVAGEIFGLKKEMNCAPKLMDSSETDADLDIADANGNVLARFEGGHIKTKEFDSSALAAAFAGIQDMLTFDDAPTASSANPVKSGGIYTSLAGKQDTLTFDDSPTESSANPVKSGGVYAGLAEKQDKLIQDTEETGTDFGITDSYGNVLARFRGGGMETKKFRGYDYLLFQSDAKTYAGAALEMKVEHGFKAGDRIVLHVERGAKPWDYGGVVTYSVDGTDVFDGIRGDNAYLTYTLTQDADEITASYGASATGVSNGDSMKLEVYLLGDIPIRPTVVRVKKDGTGDYTTLRAALDAIGTKADDVIHPYRIEIYPGTYDVMDDYTQAEIEAAAYTQTGFVGPRLYNGMTLVGIGNNTDIILSGELSTDTYSQTVRNLVSTLNLQGSCGLENLTVKAANLRYTVHDDFHSPDVKPAERTVRNCIFEAYGAMAYTYPETWGAGMSRGGTNMLFENCYFNGAVGIHTQTDMKNHPRIRMVNCSMRSIAIGDLENSENADDITEFYFDNCHIDSFGVSNWVADSYSAPHVKIYGHGGRAGALYNVPEFIYYNTVDTTDNRQHGANLSVGDAVKLSRPSSGIGWAKAETYDMARGVVIYTDAGKDEYVVQTSGLVACERVGITSYQLGDYVGVSSGALAITANAAEAIGRITYTTATRGFIELNWRR